MDSKEVFSGDIKIIVQKVLVEGCGGIILTGPSSCGKGEVAKVLRKFLTIPEQRHLSMGSILRMTIERAKVDQNFRINLAENYEISHEVSIFDKQYNDLEVYKKAERYFKELKDYYIHNDNISQLDWLEFCVMKGLLVPDDWTVKIINNMFENEKELKDNIFILDGYPRTKMAAEQLVKTFNEFSIPIIKVIHLSITKEEMKKRALGRQRVDDTEESLERRYQFYIENVQPSIDYLKTCIGASKIALVDAHQPIYNVGGKIDIEKSIQQVTSNVLQVLGLPGYLLDIK